LSKKFWLAAASIHLCQTRRELSRLDFKKRVVSRFGGTLSAGVSGGTPNSRSARQAKDFAGRETGAPRDF
jgi:hypothetical protein